eukprot:365255-Chlamydomonas_euryale.AAC.10
MLVSASGLDLSRLPWPRPVLGLGHACARSQAGRGLTRRDTRPAASAHILWKDDSAKPFVHISGKCDMHVDACVCRSCMHLLLRKLRLCCMHEGPVLTFLLCETLTGSSLHKTCAHTGCVYPYYYYYCYYSYSYYYRIHTTPPTSSRITTRSSIHRVMMCA